VHNDTQKKLYGREAFATRATAAGKRGATTDGLLAGEKAVLTLAADFRRLILAFHKFKILKIRLRRKNRSVRG
jgi:hypothetical protein